MGNYKQDKVVGWQRSRQVTIKNDYKALPTIEFAEEFVVEMDGQLINKKDVGTVGTSLKDPNKTFDLLNPENDMVIGSGNYGQAYVLLYSIYRHLADKRDIRDIKLIAFAAAEPPYKEAKAMFDKLEANVVAIRAALEKDPTSGAITKQLSDAIQARTSAAAILAEKQLEYEAAKQALEAASDYL